MRVTFLVATEDGAGGVTISTNDGSVRVTSGPGQDLGAVGAFGLAVVFAIDGQILLAFIFLLIGVLLLICQDDGSSGASSGRGPGADGSGDHGALPPGESESTPSFALPEDVFPDDGFVLPSLTLVVDAPEATETSRASAIEPGASLPWWPLRSLGWGARHVPLPFLAGPTRPDFGATFVRELLARARRTPVGGPG